MSTSIHPLRLLLKAVVLFVALNLLFAWWNPSIGKLSLYNLLWPGRLRFPYSTAPGYHIRDYNVALTEDLDGLFSSHIISAGPKPTDEFRIILLGDSAAWGGRVRADETLAAQITALGLTSCDGRRVVAYNLAYPWPSVLRDLLILEYALDYHPDLVLWLITLNGLHRKNEDMEFLLPNADRLQRIAQTHRLTLPAAPYSRRAPPSLWERTPIAQRKRLKNLLMNQIYGLMWTATRHDNGFATPSDHAVVPPDVSDKLNYLHYPNPDKRSKLIDSLLLDAIRVGQEMAKPASVVVINEPIFIATGKNREIRYNRLYPRWAYDAYRQTLAEWMDRHAYPYYDLWNALPPDDFANDLVHRDPKGEAHLASLLRPILQKFICRQSFHGILPHSYAQETDR